MKIPRLLTAFALSVTILLLIPLPASAVEPKLTVSPEKVTFGQSVSIFIEYYDMKPHLAELTFTYGTMELDRQSVWVNGSTTYQWKIKEQWSQDPNTGGEGGYDVRLWIDNQTTWGSFWVEKTWTQIGKENHENTDRMIAALNDWGKLIIGGNYGLFALFVLLIILSSLVIQHRLAKKLHKRSILERIRLWIQLNLLRISPAAFNRIDEDADSVLKAIDDLYGSLDGDPAKIHLGNFALAQKNLTAKVEAMVKKHKKGEGARA